MRVRLMHSGSGLSDKGGYRRVVRSGPGWVKRKMMTAFSLQHGVQKVKVLC